MKKIVSTTIILLFLISCHTVAQDAISPSDAANVDGTFNEAEYSYTAEENGMMIGVSITRDNMVYAGIQAETEGWVALGFDATVMDGSRMMLASMSNGNVNFREDAGQGHGHSREADQITETYAVSENNGITVMELAVPISDLDALEGSLDLIYAFGGSDSFSSYHRARGATSLNISR
ncbi:MAG: DOMON domain-containing protein [Spirochaetia bacterium]